MKRRREKKNPFVKALAGAFCIIGGALAAGIAAIGATAVRNSKKMKQHENENNYMTSCLFQNEEIELKPDTQNVYLTVLFSVAHIMVPRPEKDCLNIEITSFAGNMILDMPDGVTIRCKGSKYADFARNGAEACPVINLVIHDCASSLAVKYA
ncbi:MAG: hypothetical protein K6B72_01560 [Lachnospiraceae bacterium]|nr:hypothetical protein [Lachnospiraceae bacterium]